MESKALQTIEVRITLFVLQPLSLPSCPFGYVRAVLAFLHSCHHPGFTALLKPCGRRAATSCVSGLVILSLPLCFSNQSVDLYFFLSVPLIKSLCYSSDVFYRRNWIPRGTWVVCGPFFHLLDCGLTCAVQWPHYFSFCITLVKKFLGLIFFSTCTSSLFDRSNYNITLKFLGC